MKLSFSAFTFRREYFLFLLPLFFVLHGYRENAGMVNTGEALRLLLAYLAFFTGLALVLFFIFRSFRKAALFATAVMAVHFFFGSIHDGLKWLLPGSIVVKYIFLLPMFLFLLLASFIYLKRTGRRFDRLARYLNIMLLVLILFDAGTAILNERNHEKPEKFPTGFIACDTCEKPDVFLIIADEYAGTDALKNILHFDNTPFIDSLKQRGFYIVPHSSANYNWSPYSVASLLDMNYLQGVSGKPGSRENFGIAYNTINDGAVVRFFSGMGYSVKNLSIFEVAGQSPMTSQTFLPRGTNLVTNQTLLSRVNRDIRFNLVTRFKWRSEIHRFAAADLRNNNMLIDALEKEAAGREEKPRFVYTHLLLPHYPYYYDEKGKEAPLEEIDEGDKSNEKMYLGYLQYGNRVLLQLVDSIMKGSRNPPLIILCGDHGFRHFKAAPGTERYYFNNLNAVFLPGGNYQHFRDSLSLVNQFRVILNTSFGQQLPLLKDSAIFLKE